MGRGRVAPPRRGDSHGRDGCAGARAPVPEGAEGGRRRRRRRQAGPRPLRSPRPAAPLQPDAQRHRAQFWRRHALPAARRARLPPHPPALREVGSRGDGGVNPLPVCPAVVPRPAPPAPPRPHRRGPLAGALGAGIRRVVLVPRHGRDGGAGARRLSSNAQSDAATDVL